MIAAKSASISPEMVPISRCMALCRTVTGLRGHSASDHGDRYALGALYARQDTRILLRNGQHPIPRHRPLHSFFFFFFSFFPRLCTSSLFFSTLSLSRSPYPVRSSFSLFAFNHHRDSLSLSPRGDAHARLLLWIRLARNTARLPSRSDEPASERISCESYARVSENENVLRTC